MEVKTHRSFSVLGGDEDLNIRESAKSPPCLVSCLSFLELKKQDLGYAKQRVY